ncbi:MAG: DUF2760 domain-containing protein [Verrucomicrobia bacterium]|nr:DUF2760 domain-containing protein [Verrucomicrobiota bacterium]MBV9298266.1 DUF2760 domain-containing protein [Verrucomicrobiota bacterium]
MKPFVAVGAILLVILNGLLLVPATVGHTFPIALVAFVIALLLLVFAILSRDSGTSRPAVRVATPAPPPAPIQPPAPVAKQSEAEIVAFFSLLQEKGRLIDFLMEDIARYEDAEVGAAARVIHQGCQQVIKEYFSISAISEAQEGAQVTVPAGYSPDQYRLVGKLTGNPPFTGTLLHKGWKTEFVKLPRIATTERLPSIAPAEVELK